MLNFLTETWIRHCVILFLLTFVQEDVAIVAAAFSKVEYGLPFLLAFLSVFTGIVTGDLLIYGLGWMARKSPWLRERIIGPRVDQMKIWLENNFKKVAAICRITPGLLFPTFIAFGWFRISAKRFITVSVITALLYSFVAMLLVLALGQTVFSKLGYWSWGLMLMLALAYPVIKSVKSLAIKKEMGGTKGELVIPFLDGVRKNGKREYHKGMPSLSGIKRLIAQAERLPDWLFYFPVGLRWIWLSIRHFSLTMPSITNPLIENGGFWGESKSKILDCVDASKMEYLARYVTFKRQHSDVNIDLQAAGECISNSSIEYPFVVKPDIGWQGFGVRLLKTTGDLLAYLQAYPLNVIMIFQEYISFDGEAGVFYARKPDEEKGSVFSLTLRYFPFVTGDGISSVKELIRRNPRTGFKSHYFLGTHSGHRGLSPGLLDKIPGEGEMVRLAFIGSIRVGGIYRDARHSITPELSECFDEIAKSIPEFYYGRFDIRFRSIESLMAGKDFYIFEINGSGSEPIHAWDPEVPFFRVYKELFKTQKLMFEIAGINRKRGFNPVPVVDFIKAFHTQNKLLKSYPGSE